MSQCVLYTILLHTMLCMRLLGSVRVICQHIVVYTAAITTGTLVYIIIYIYNK